MIDTYLPFQVNRDVSIKAQLSTNPRQDHAVLGTFFFRRAGDMLGAVEALIRSGRRTNGEFYLDDAINCALAHGKRAAVFEATYLGWGTPNDVRTYEYWHRYFARAGAAV